MARGGARPGAGRPKGAATAKTRAIADAAAASGLTPLDYLLEIMRDANNETAQRVDAAKAAAPYMHPRLASVDVGNKDEKPFETVMRWAQTATEATPDPSTKS